MELKATTHQLGSNWLKHLKTDGGNDGGSHLVIKQMNRLKPTFYIGEHMKNKILVRENLTTEGKYGHAELIGKDERNKISVEHYEVRMLDSYDVPRTHTVASFFIYYEVMNDVD